jgi:hypothetical protein
MIAVIHFELRAHADSAFGHVVLLGDGEKRHCIPAHSREEHLRHAPNETLRGVTVSGSLVTRREWGEDQTGTWMVRGVASP